MTVNIEDIAKGKAPMSENSKISNSGEAKNSQAKEHPSSKKQSNSSISSI
jgi:hypothetical protein